MLNDGKRQVWGITKAVRDAWGAKGGRWRSTCCNHRGGPKGAMQHHNRAKYLYGAACHYTTEKQFAEMRRVMCTAMGDKEGRRPDSVRLLVEGGGKCDPEVLRMKRLVNHWQTEATFYAITTEHWDALAGTSGKQGPISEAKHTLDNVGVACHNRDRWEVSRRVVDVLRDADSAETIFVFAPRLAFHCPLCAIRRAL